MSKIQIIDLHNVIIAEVNNDDIFAAIRNNPELREQLETDALNWALGSSNAYRAVGELSAKLDALKLACESAVADRDRIAKLLADASAAFDAGDVTTLQAMRAEAQKSDKQKALDTALAEKAAAEAKIAELSE